MTGKTKAMKYEKHIYLKDGRGCVVRNASANDGPQVAEVYARQHEETDDLRMRHGDRKSVV